jgi:hypothetical protein
MMHLSNIVLGAAGCHIPESKPTRNTSKIPLDPVSSKNNVIFKTTVKWMPKRNISNAAIHKA